MLLAEVLERNRTPEDKKPVRERARTPHCVVRMAFFGLTTLGPQNSFTEHLKTRSKLCVFEAAEFEVRVALAAHF